MAGQYFQADDSQGGEEDYLSRLANSILKKEQREPTGVPPGGISQSQLQQRRSGVPPFRVDPSRTTPVPVAVAPATPEPVMNTPRPDSQTGVPRLAGEWVRKVDMIDANGELLPGTILVFEDGMMGIFKEKNRRKDYDIVYILDGRGRATPQGIPLYNYSVEPVGRLSAACLESVISHGRWDRDMIVFHLLRYRDRAYVPAISEHAQDAEPIANSEHLSQMSVQKLTPEMLQPDFKPTEEPEKPALVRGREMTIEFGPGRKWNAIYWGKDELGHVVAHNTHDQWSLMHLDLNRFKDCIAFGNIANGEVLRKMERDITKT